MVLPQLKLLTEISYESGCKQKETRVDKRSDFCNRSMKSWLQGNDIEMCSRHSNGKSVVAERFIRTLKTKFRSV